jgi:hypothetical protein
MTARNSGSTLCDVPTASLVSKVPRMIPFSFPDLANLHDAQAAAAAPTSHRFDHTPVNGALIVLL